VSKVWPYQRACHLIADTIAELMEFAESIGLKSEWFQNKDTPHFDLNESRHKQALAKGAILLGNRDFCLKMRRVEKAKQLDIFLALQF
jgi:hypothetical protein